ncbi:MAG: class I SAM-dependent methyltransferase [Chlamydiia bacterium]|nr:class I SAM-dependent methyltransferase [Chlamydiia bacterium]
MTFPLPLSQDDEDKSSPLKNCIRNNYRHVRKWANRTMTNCFRIYDRDIKEYPIAIDFYAGRFCIHYFTFSRDSDEPKDSLRRAAEEALASLFGANASALYWRTRIKREKIEQYEKMDKSKEFFPVLEYGISFWVNLTDYLDTGLFLDHRETRKYVASLSQGKKVLNLFAYTCAFSIHAAKAGALLTKSVDLSNTYIAWGKDNFILNHIPLQHHSIIRADCLKFLETEQETYDIVILDPPTLSRSKKMEQMFDIQIDYVFLLSKALNLLNPGGLLIFSTNSRKFSLDPNLLPPCHIAEVSNKTLPIDFRDPKIHRCWLIKSP